MNDKPAMKSVTILAAVAFAVIQTLESLGVVPPGGFEAIATLAKSLLGVLGVYGLRRAISTNGLNAIFGPEVLDEEADLSVPYSGELELAEPEEPCGCSCPEGTDPA